MVSRYSVSSVRSPRTPRVNCPRGPDVSGLHPGRTADAADMCHPPRSPVLPWSWSSFLRPASLPLMLPRSWSTLQPLQPLQSLARYHVRCCYPSVFIVVRPACSSDICWEVHLSTFHHLHIIICSYHTVYGWKKNFVCRCFFKTKLADVYIMVKRKLKSDKYE